ncbi:DUF1850 domain-containing protein [Salinisphaera hydrothermalis]|uniref:DUF1850 domain-containing protein n=1 Tax=Salinisphaera hydrothermalis (strain C41B8) TaxID=1304275 RepID=A0A084IHN1_SALHC|nr:DUF1850 domain-containing protein [Salinisphaera hydrothermalis]KEZ76215.1 hypothetical protein C41B8_16139 [Salinisphaera hydrothermalis C41B8]
MGRRYRGWRAWRLAVGGVLLVAVALWLGWPRPWLEIKHGTTLIAVYPGASGTRFSLRWMHSVEREDWIECYRVVGRKIDIAATRFKTFGAGVPAHAGRRTQLVNGWVVMSGIDRDVDPLTVQAAAAERYRFRYGDGLWHRLSYGRAEPILVFAIVRAPLIAVAGSRLATLWRGPDAASTRS